MQSLGQGLKQALVMSILMTIGLLCTPCTSASCADSNILYSRTVDSTTFTVWCDSAGQYAYSVRNESSKWKITGARCVVWMHGRDTSVVFQGFCWRSPLEADLPVVCRVLAPRSTYTDNAVDAINSWHSRNVVRLIDRWDCVEVGNLPSEPVGFRHGDATLLSLPEYNAIPVKVYYGP